MKDNQMAASLQQVKDNVQSWDSTKCPPVKWEQHGRLGIVPKLSTCCPEVWEAWNCPKVVFMLSQSFQQSTLQSSEHNIGCLKMTKDADIINPQVLPSEDGPPAYRDSSLREGKALWLKNSNCKSLVLGEGGPQGMYSKVSSSLVIFNRHFAPAQSSNLMTWRSKSAGGLS